MSPDPGAQPVTQASGRTLTEMRLERRDALLTAIAKARRWIDDVQLGCIGSVAGIADCDVAPATKVGVVDRGGAGA
jgi:hypothetical protein